MEPCISGGAKKILHSLIDDLKQEASPKRVKTLTKLKALIEEMPICKIGRAAKKPRKVSKWQRCIQKERKGKPFDPQAIRELAKKYRRGECP